MGQGRRLRGAGLWSPSRVGPREAFDLLEPLSFQNPLILGKGEEDCMEAGASALQVLQEQDHGGHTLKPGPLLHPFPASCLAQCLEVHG